MLVEQLKKISVTNEILEDCDIISRYINDRLEGKPLLELTKLEELKIRLDECLDEIEYWNNRKNQIELEIISEGLC